MSAKLALPIFLSASALLLSGCNLQSLKQKAAVTSQPENEVSSVVSPSPAESETEKPVSAGLILNITSPTNNSTVSTSSVKLQGQTTAGAEIFVNDLETKADSQGNFSLNLKLEEGENEFAIIATDDEGNSAETTLTVTYAPNE